MKMILCLTSLMWIYFFFSDQNKRNGLCYENDARQSGAKQLLIHNVLFLCFKHNVLLVRQFVHLINACCPLSNITLPVLNVV